MNKLFKYVAFALDEINDDVTFEIRFESNKVLKRNDVHTVVVNHAPKDFRITSVQKIDHVNSPNLQYDYRLIAVAV